jgi:hypothetical protein
MEVLPSFAVLQILRATIHDLTDERRTALLAEAQTALRPSDRRDAQRSSLAGPGRTSTIQDSDRSRPLVAAGYE